MSQIVKGGPSGPQKAALVLLALDQAVAADVLRHLDERDLRRLAECAEALGQTATQSLQPALEEFDKKMSEVVLAHDAGAYLRQLTASSLGADKAQKLFAPNKQAPQPLDTIRSARASTLAELLGEENPQLAAVIISQLPRAQAAKILVAIPEEKQADLIARIAGLKELPSELVHLASQALADALAAAGGSADPTSASSQFNGVSFAAQLLNELQPGESERLLGALQENQAELAPKVREAMFTFEDLSRLETRALQVLMRDVQSEKLLIALKTASESLREKFLGAVSSRAAATMREDLAAMPPTRLSDVEAAQREIIETATKLAADGKLVLPGSAAEKLV